MIHITGPREHQVDWVINTTSTAKGWSRGLSPFLIGPVPLYGDYIAKNVENGWQRSKVFKGYVDEYNNPTPSYFKWAQQGWNDKKAHRYPMGKGVKPLYLYWNGEKLDYIEARKKVYLKLYSYAVSKTSAFEYLCKLSLKQDIWLWDFDGYDHEKLGMSLEDVLNCETKKCGHAFVLKMMINGECGFENCHYIDKVLGLC